jgi:hypothetical protein
VYVTPPDALTVIWLFPAGVGPAAVEVASPEPLLVPLLLPVVPDSVPLPFVLSALEDEVTPLHPSCKATVRQSKTSPNASNRLCRFVPRATNPVGSTVASPANKPVHHRNALEPAVVLVLSHPVWMVPCREHGKITLATLAGELPDLQSNECP